MEWDEYLASSEEKFMRFIRQANEKNLVWVSWPGKNGIQLSVQRRWLNGFSVAFIAGWDNEKNLDAVGALKLN